MKTEPHSATVRPSAQTDQVSGPILSGRARQGRGFALAVMGLVLVFAVPIWQLIHFAFTSEFHSYILLIPFISLYLVWLKRKGLRPTGPPARLAGVISLASGVALLGVYWLLLHHVRLVEDDSLALMMSAFLLCFLGICCLFCDKATLRRAAFPLALLIFMVPIPTFAIPPIDAFLQNGSAAFAEGFFSLFGTPFLRTGLAFQLPDITIQIAPECSGIQSSLVLFITGLLAAYLFLRTPWKRTFLALFVVALGLIRNGFRVFVIGELCVHIGPQMINSNIHHKGGPIFFALSLIPLFLVLIVLQRSEKSRGQSDSKAPETKHA